MPSSLPKLLRIAATQHGVVSSRQAINVGHSHMSLTRAVRSGVLERVGPGVYVASGSPPTWRRDLMIKVCAAGPGAVASHGAAYALWCPDVTPPATLDVTTDRPRRHNQHDPDTHRTRRLFPRDRTTIDNIPCVSLPRSLFDMAGRESVDDIVDAIDRARRERSLSVGALLQCLDTYRGRGWRGTSTFETAIASVGPTVPDSAFERMVIDHLVAAGIERPVLHHAVRVEGVVMAVDLAWPSAMVALELDGKQHRDTRQQRVDARRDARLRRLGYTVVRITWADWVTRRRQIVESLRTAGVPLARAA